jgi:poly(3-hydroxybutyrate) depolymerase
MPNNSQKTQTDQFAKVNGCTIETLPTAETGKHVCTPYKGCKDGFPVTWCSYDGGHGFQDTDSGSSTDLGALDGLGVPDAPSFLEPGPFS